MAARESVSRRPSAEMTKNSRRFGGMTKPIILLALLLCLSGYPESVCPQEDRHDRIEALYDACDTPERFGGFAAAVLKDGEVIFEKAYGYADFEHKVPFTTSTIADYASVAKQFTGFAVAMLIKEGKLRLHDDIRMYVPEVPDFGDTITVDHLLHHTSGIRDWVGLVKISGRYMEDVITDDFIMKLVKNQKDLNFRPGEKFQYSNTGYFLLANIVSRITGTSFREWTQENIFKPLQMNDTHFSDDHAEIVTNRAHAYKKDISGNYVNSPSNLEAYGSSSLFSSLDDMVKWVQNFGSETFGGEELWNMMLRKGVLKNGQEFNYGFGVDLNDRYGNRSYGHGGSWGGCLSQVAFYPDLGLASILITNRDPSGVYVDEEVLKLFLDTEAEEARSKEKKELKQTEVEIDPRLLLEYDGTYRSENFVFNVEIVDDHLIIHFPWSESHRVYPESNERFFIRNMNIAFSFLRDESGKVDRLIYHFKGTDNAPCFKLESDVSKYPNIADLCGDYTSEELQTTYTLKIQDNRLIAAHLHNENVRLMPINANRWVGNQWWFKDLRFIRNEHERIIGFKLNADENNIQNLLFTKKLATK